MPEELRQREGFCRGLVRVGSLIAWGTAASRDFGPLWDTIGCRDCHEDFQNDFPVQETKNARGQEVDIWFILTVSAEGVGYKQEGGAISQEIS